MNVIGLNLDLYDAGATLACNGRLQLALNEERYTRRKNQGGFPHHALAACLDALGRTEQVDRIVVAGTTTPPLPMRLFPGLHRNLSERQQEHGSVSPLRYLADAAVFYTPLSRATAESAWGRATRPMLAPLLRRHLPAALRQTPIAFVEHHHAHAAAAHHLSGFDESLCLSGDGMGDGLSFTVSRWQGSESERLWQASASASLGLFFEALTEAFGFTPCRDEGKITGLAAWGNAEIVAAPTPFQFDGDALHYRGPRGLRAVQWIREKILAVHGREHTAAWAQAILEDTVCAIAKRWIAETGLRKLSLSGGIFANVKLNQRLQTLDAVDEIFVCPNMGDGGLSVGTLCAEGLLEARGVDAVFWGSELGTVEDHGVVARAVETLAAGGLVARCTGPMEWGPRALGNRSILADAADPSVNARLNEALQRSDFMPFAPALREEDADRYLKHWRKGRRAAPFMTTCFDVTNAMQADAPAVVHVDGTARAQLVSRESNAPFYAILDAFHQKTGRGILLNTSFNMHEEPIVRTKEEGLDAFRRAGLDGMILGGEWLEAER